MDSPCAVFWASNCWAARFNWAVWRRWTASEDLGARLMARAVPPEPLPVLGRKVWVEGVEPNHELLLALPLT